MARPVPGWSAVNNINDTRVKFNIWSDATNRRHPKVNYTSLIGIDNPSQAQIRTISPTDVFEYYMTEFTCRVVSPTAIHACNTVAARANGEPRCLKNPGFHLCMRVYVAMLIMSLNHERWTKDYWRQSDLMGVPLMRKVIGRDRFWTYYPMVLSWDIEKFEVYMNARFQQVWIPSSFIACDELMSGFKGRSKNNVFLPRKKSAQNGLKLFSLNDSTPGFSYLYDVTSYRKKDTRKNGAGVPLGSTVVSLLQNAHDVLPDHCIIFADRFFSSYDNGKLLNRQGRAFAFSVRKDRPKTLWIPLMKDLEVGETNMIQNNQKNSIVAMAFRDRRATFLMLSNGVGSC
jgi:hypothetical protein